MNRKELVVAYRAKTKSASSLKPLSHLSVGYADSTAPYHAIYFRSGAMTKLEIGRGKCPQIIWGKPRVYSHTVIVIAFKKTEGI